MRSDVDDKPNESFKIIWIPQTISSIMLLWAFNPENPYGYYILLRWVCCPLFAYLAFHAIDQEKEAWVWMLGVTAVIYNPILRIHLTRDIWSVINLVTIVISVASLFVLKTKSEMPTKGSDKTSKLISDEPRSTRKDRAKYDKYQCSEGTSLVPNQNSF